MTLDRKKPGVAFWATVVGVVLLVLYPLSIGPAAWLRVHALPPSTREAMDMFYRPMGLVTRHSNTANQAALRYICLWVNLEDFGKTAADHQ